jgi:hypothetical protein
MRPWSHFSRHEDDSHLQRLSEDELGSMRRLHEGLEEVHTMVEDLPGDCGGFDYRDDLRKIIGFTEDLRARIESNADDCGAAV